CPYCKNFHASMLQLFKDYGKDIKWVFRHFPLSQLHSKAPKEAEAAECAGELAGNDGFWKFIDKIFEVTPGNNGLDQAELPKIAVSIGLDEKKFTECLNSGKYTAKVQDSINQAALAGVTGTPYTAILAGGEQIPINGAVAYDQLKSAVESALTK
ncbi:MAG: thioredoxin domain-containing protein, partial [Candidatus Komeilibacteria bacterium]|nr:thioredoxin domain-containing protein [Candidatus Komeilibacteria bacterium]